MAHFGDYQNEIYFKGLRGIRPNLPVDFRRLEERASAVLSQSVLAYVQGGCGDEATQRRNVEAFAEWGIVPRMLVDTRVRDLSVDVFGKRYKSPLMLSPIGVIGVCAQDGHGDIATASLVVNSIPKVLAAPPGLHTMRDLPLPSFFSGR